MDIIHQSIPFRLPQSPSLPAPSPSITPRVASQHSPYSSDSDRFPELRQRRRSGSDSCHSSAQLGSRRRSAGALAERQSAILSGGVRRRNGAGPEHVRRTLLPTPPPTGAGFVAAGGPRCVIQHRHWRCRRAVRWMCSDHGAFVPAAGRGDLRDTGEAPVDGGECGGEVARCSAGYVTGMG